MCVENSLLMNAYMLASMHVCLHIFAYVCTYGGMYVSMHVCTYGGMYVAMHVCRYVGM